MREEAAAVAGTCGRYGRVGAGITGLASPSSAWHHPPQPGIAFPRATHSPPGAAEPQTRCWGCVGGDFIAVVWVWQPWRNP